MSLFVVTGASRGLGASLVRQLLDQGHAVIAAARGPAPASSDRLDWTSLDLSDAQAARNWVVARLAGLARPDRACLILNAGMLEPLGAVESLQAGAIDLHMRLNLVSPMLVTGGFLEASAAWGIDRRILAISSGAARRGIPHWAAYCASKAGLDGFVRALNTEQGGIKAVSMAPGVIDTEMQRVIREVPTPTQDRFLALHANGDLATADDAASNLLKYLIRDDFGAHEIDDLRESMLRSD